MDEPETGKEQAKTAENPEHIASAPAVENEKQDAPPGEKAEISAEKNTDPTPETWLQELLGVGADRKIELILAAAIAFFAFCQLVVMCSGSGQTAQLITAAKSQACSARKIAEASERNATAAESFATSAGLINTGIGDAVKKLAAQSKAAQDSLALTQKNFIMEERPYVIVGKSHLEEDEKGNQTLTTASPVMWRVEVINYGKSPAVNYGGVGKVFFGQDAQQLAFAYMKSMPTEIKKIGSKPNAGPDGIIPPRGADTTEKPTYTTVVSDKTPTKEDLLYMASHEFALYAVGRLFYTDLQGNRYSTDYCRFRFLSGATADCSKYDTVR